jgi:hypothetical protein
VPQKELHIIAFDIAPCTSQFEPSGNFCSARGWVEQDPLLGRIPSAWSIQATHRGGVHTVITWSTEATTGCTISICILLPGCHWLPRHSILP